MADAVTLVMSPTESIKEFNRRLKTTCDELLVTNVQLIVVDGQPVVTLMSEIVEATKEDVEDAKALDPNDDIKEKDEIPEEPPLMVNVLGIETLDFAPVPDKGKPACARTEERMATIFGRAQGAVGKVLHATGSKPLLTQIERDFFGAPSRAVTYVLVGWYKDEDAEDSASGKV